MKGGWFIFKMENEIKEKKFCSENDEGCVSGESPRGEYKICFSGDNSKENRLCWVGVKYFQVSKVQEQNLKKD